MATEIDELDPSLLSNIEVAEFLRDVMFYEVPCLGVYPVNDLPAKQLLETNHWLVIINLDHCYETGSHFVILCRNPDKRLFFFDSAALPVLPKKLISLISLIADDMKTTAWALNKPIQALNSKACGYFCIYFTLLWQFCDTSYADMDSIFLPMTEKDNLEDNETLAYRQIKKLIAFYVAKRTLRLQSLRLFELPIFPKINCNHPVKK